MFISTLVVYKFALSPEHLFIQYNIIKQLSISLTLMQKNCVLSQEKKFCMCKDCTTGFNLARSLQWCNTFQTLSRRLCTISYWNYMHSFPQKKNCTTQCLTFYFLFNWLLGGKVFIALETWHFSLQLKESLIQKSKSTRSLNKVFSPSKLWILSVVQSGWAEMLHFNFLVKKMAAEIRTKSPGQKPQW